MSDSDNTPTPPPATTPKTAAVPLKKETVRITLRGRPSAGVTQPREATAPVSPATGKVPSLHTTSAVPTVAKKSTAPIQLPSAPLPPPAPKSSTAPVKLPSPPPAPSKRTTSAVPVASAPPPAAPAPSAPVPPPARPVGPPTAPRPVAPPSAGLPAATRPLAQNPGAAPRVETGAPTVPLQKKPGPAAPRAPGASTGPMAGSAPLPKATVKLAPTQVMKRPSISAPPSAPVKRSAAADAEQFYEEKDPEAGLVPLSVICFVLSALLMVVQMFGADAVQSDPTGTSPIMVPSENRQAWESRNAVTGVWTNKFKETLPAIP